MAGGLRKSYAAMRFGGWAANTTVPESAGVVKRIRNIVP